MRWLTVRVDFFLGSEIAQYCSTREEIRAECRAREQLARERREMALADAASQVELSQLLALAPMISESPCKLLLHTCLVFNKAQSCFGSNVYVFRDGCQEIIRSGRSC